MELEVLGKVRVMCYGEIAAERVRRAAAARAQLSQGKGKHGQPWKVAKQADQGLAGSGTGRARLADIVSVPANPEYDPHAVSQPTVKIAETDEICIDPSLGSWKARMG
jgi:hypothetical protein